LKLAKESGDKKGEAAALLALANIHLKERKADQAKFRALAAVEAYKGLKSKVGEACASNALALAYLANKEYQQAQELSSQALKIFIDELSNGGRAMVMYTIAQIALEEGKKDEALLMLEDIAKLYSDISDYGGTGLAELASAEIYLASFELQQAINKATAASELFEGVGDSKKRGASVLLMAKAFEKTGQVTDMLSCAQAAYAFFEEARDQRGKALCLDLSGKASIAMRDFKAAIFSFENAAFLSRQLKDRPKEAEMLDQLAKAQLESLDTLADTPAGGWQPDDILAPVRNSKRACALFTEIGAAQSIGMAMALQTLALALLNTTAAEESLGRTLESRRIFKLLGDLSGEAAAVMAGARVLAMQKQKDQALRFLQDASSLAEESGDPDTIRRVQRETMKIQSMAKPATAGAGTVISDFFIGSVGEELAQFEYYESRSVSIPGSAPKAPTKKGGKGIISIDRESAPRVPQQYPVLFETKKIPATVAVA
jgi:tetratricopeptide (TPR) repeat protein